MKQLTEKERLEIIEHTKRVAASMKTHKKGRYEFKSNFANFSANPYVEDSGNPTADESGIYDDCQTFADFNTKAREQVAFGRIKSLVANSNVAASVKTYVLQRNESIRAANKIAESKKAKKKSNVSKPFWY